LRGDHSGAVPNSSRFRLANIPLHIVQRGNNGEDCFRDDEDFLEYLGRLAAASRKFDVAVHAYVLMTNHVHLLATPTSLDGVGKRLQAVGSAYVPIFNARHHRSGTLWDGRFYSSLVGSDSYLWNCHRYIELNPVRAGLVHEPGRYRWSSFPRNAMGSPDSVVTPHPAYHALGANAAAAYLEMFGDALADQTVIEIRETIRRELAFGSEAFLDDLEVRANRSSRPKARGRPKGPSKNRSDLFS
jgi:putative transposase